LLGVTFVQLIDAEARLEENDDEDEYDKDDDGSDVFMGTASN
jgi:hypothetical protein